MTAWRKSSRSSDTQSADCVELASLGATVGIRDSKSPDSGHITMEAERFAALVQGVKSGKYDR